MNIFSSYKSTVLLWLIICLLLPVGQLRSEDKGSSASALRLRFDLNQGPPIGLAIPLERTARVDTTPHSVHPDSIPYRTDPTFGRQLLALPSNIFHMAVLPLKWSIIWIDEHQVLKQLSDFFLNEEKTAGFYPSFSFGGRTPFAAGITYFDRDVFNSGHSLDFSTFYTNRDNFNVGATYKIPPNKFRRHQVFLSGTFRKNDGQDIFLAGNSSSDDLEASYKIEKYSLQPEFGYLLGGSILPVVGVGFSHTVIDDFSTFTESGERVGQIIDSEGFGFGTTSLGNLSGIVIFDFRNAEAQNKYDNLVSTVTTSYNFKQTKMRVYSGALLDAGIRYSRSLSDDQYEFFTYYGDWQQFFAIPGLLPNRRLAFRARLEKRYPLDRSSVPFFEQSILGDADNLRGFEQDRFRDLGSLLLTLEYRYPIWDTWDAVVFTDQGQVFREFNELEFSRFHSAVGTGLRFMTASDFLFRVEIAFSREGPQSLLEFNMNF